MKTTIKETFSLFITDSVYVNTFQFLTLNYRLYSANFWYNQCEKNEYFFDSLKNNEFFPKLIDFNDSDNKTWNENFLSMVLNNKALAEMLYKDQNPQVKVFDANCNLIETTDLFSALENYLFGNLDPTTLNKLNPYNLPIKENKSSHDLNLIQIDLDGAYLNLTSELELLDDYIDSLKLVENKSIIMFNTQRTFFDTFDYMLYFLFKYKSAFYLCCDNGTSLYKFAFYKEHIVWTKIKNHSNNKMYLKAVYDNKISYNIVFDDQQYFDSIGYEDGKYKINNLWTISYYSNFECNKTDLVEELIDEYYAERIANIINIDDNNNSSMFDIKLKNSSPQILNYTINTHNINNNSSMFDIKLKNSSPQILNYTINTHNINNNSNINYLEDSIDWITKIEYNI